MIEAMLHSPFFGMVLCLVTYLLGKWVQNKTKSVLANPLLIAVVICVTLLVLLDIPYDCFAKGGDVINWMLGPVTVLLALGIYNQRTILKQYFVPVLVGCTVGSAISMGSVLLLCRLFRVDNAVTAAMLPKGCTNAIAVGIAESHGGITAITVACVMITGIIGALCAPLFCRWFRITDPVAQGLAMGTASHAIGTTKAREMGEVQGAMSSIAIGVCGLISVVFSLFVRL